MRATRREKNGKDKGKAMSAMWLTRHTARDTRMNSHARLIRVDDDRRACRVQGIFVRTVSPREPRTPKDVKRMAAGEIKR